jgi:hypothetical protein
LGQVAGGVVLVLGNVVAGVHQVAGVPGGADDKLLKSGAIDAPPGVGDILWAHVMGAPHDITRRWNINARSVLLSLQQEYFLHIVQAHH